MFDQAAMISAPAADGARRISSQSQYDSQTMATSTAQTNDSPKATVLEFFAGIGLARMGLERAGLQVIWANDIDEKKHELYRTEFAEDHSEYLVGSVASVVGSELPKADVAWASFPCTDLSLAGGRSGMAGKHSSTFYEFTRVLEEMPQRPAVVIVENVTALATSHGGDDLRAVIQELNKLGYSVDMLAMDARRFVPQSRPRLFLVGSQVIPARTTMEGGELRPSFLEQFFEDPELRTHCTELPVAPAERIDGFTKLAERLGAGDEQWWDEARTEKFISSLSEMQLARMEKLRAGKQVVFRTAYRRTRGGVPMWEIRADDVAGCLRTARGGSSKQAVVQVGKGAIRVRWMTGREYARLMGADEYDFGDATFNQILFGFGDAVCVPAVEWLVRHAVLPLLTPTLRPTETVEVRLGSLGDKANQEVAAIS